MAVHSLILQMNERNEPATMELPDGKWCHTPIYVHRRYTGFKVKPAEGHEPKPSRASILADQIFNKMTPAERALLLAKLLDK